MSIFNVNNYCDLSTTFMASAARRMPESLSSELCLGVVHLLYTHRGGRGKDSIKFSYLGNVKKVLRGVRFGLRAHYILNERPHTVHDPMSYTTLYAKCSERGPRGARLTPDPHNATPLVKAV